MLPLSSEHSQPLPLGGSAPSIVPTYSAYSILHLGFCVSGRVLFPGRTVVPDRTLGYVRSGTRAKLAAPPHRPGDHSRRQLPWRDYPPEALVSVDALISAPYERHTVVISARNSLNEWGYQLRLGGRWHRRYLDPAVDLSWPVVQVGSQGVNLICLSDADADSDLVSGIPLVIDGIPSSRSFLVASCSDVAHVFDVDPKGRRGTPAKTWLQLSNLWQQLKDEGLKDEELAGRMEATAADLLASPSRHLLHSVLAQRYDGLLMAFAVTGALTDIAFALAQRWEIQHAILLDNGGSVGWQVLVQGASAPALIVSTPNYRPRGTAFIVFNVSSFVHPQSHGALHYGTQE